MIATGSSINIVSLYTFKHFGFLPLAERLRVGEIKTDISLIVKTIIKTSQLLK